MRRVSIAAAAFAALLASRADAIEMFTNFNNGMNVGFPPMEVPIGIYRGIGHGGWNPRAEGMYFRSNPPVPAMMPTGQMPRPVIRTSGVSDKTFSSADTSADVQYVADRRRGSTRSQRMPSSAPMNSMPSTSGSATISPNESSSTGRTGPTPAKAPETEEAAPARLPSNSVKVQRSVTVLRAQSGKPQTNAAVSGSANESRESDSSRAKLLGIVPEFVKLAR